MLFRSHERDRKGSIQTTQEVEIYFNFVGRFVPPAFGEVELTPEELEEIRKREERKDRLHQNYLKRKASGAQKRYEDKIKERKKTEIEAKKAAIRAEDIAKGVFVPVFCLICIILCIVFIPFWIKLMPMCPGFRLSCSGKIGRAHV